MAAARWVTVPAARLGKQNITSRQGRMEDHFARFFVSAPRGTPASVELPFERCEGTPENIGICEEATNKWSVFS